MPIFSSAGTSLFMRMPRETGFLGRSVVRPASFRMAFSTLATPFAELLPDERLRPSWRSRHILGVIWSSSVSSR